MMPQGVSGSLVPNIGPIIKLRTSVQTLWLSISSTNFVSFEALFEKYSYFDLKTAPEIPEFVGKFMNFLA
jgi:hypothetical protein